jgi:putative ABC transport system ATP-binding protein
MDKNNTIVVLKNVTKNFRYQGSMISALNNVSFGLPKGTMAAIMGPTGSGKTTLLNIIGALERPTSGEVLVDGISVHNLADRKLVEYRRNKVGFVFQLYNLLPSLSAIENVELPLELGGLSASQRHARARHCLELVGFPVERYLHRINYLSGGEQQRVVIARALTHDPAIILADEPTGDLDDETSVQIMRLLHRLTNEQNKTILVVTHSDTIAKWAGIQIRIKRGEILQ